MDDPCHILPLYVEFESGTDCLYIYIYLYLVKKRPFWWRGEAEMGEGILLLGMSLNFFIPTSLQSSASATITSGCLPIWNLIHNTKHVKHDTLRGTRGLVNEINWIPWNCCLETRNLVRIWLQSLQVIENTIEFNGRLEKEMSDLVECYIIFSIFHIIKYVGRWVRKIFDYLIKLDNLLYHFSYKLVVLLVIFWLCNQGNP